MKKIVVFALTISLLFPVFAQTVPESGKNNENQPDLTPVPYDDDEFSQWSRDLRRAEIIFFGSTPFTFLFSAVGYRTGKYAFNSLTADTGESVPGWNELEQDDQKNMVFIGLGLSLSIAVIDYILGRIQRNRNDQS